MVIMEMLKTHAYQVCIAWFATLRSEEVVIVKVPEAIFCSWLSWKCSSEGNMRTSEENMLTPICPHKQCVLAAHRKVFTREHTKPL